MDEAGKGFEDIYREFFPRILAYLGRLVGRNDAEDVAQEVFLKVNAGLAGFRGDSSLSTWIYRIATNSALDHRRRSSSGGRAEGEGEEKTDGHGSDAADVEDKSIPPFDRQLIRKEMNDCIREIVDGLSENYRTVLILSDFEGLADAEVAEVTGMTLQTVKIRLHRARARMKKELERRCDFYRDDRNELACDRKPLPLKFFKK